MEPAELKAILAPYQSAALAGDGRLMAQAMRSQFADDLAVHLCHPFGSLQGTDAFEHAALTPLLVAFPDLERRDLIVMAGRTPEGQDWVGCMGNYLGTFLAPLLDIPPTGRLAHMRYHEFFRIDDGRVVEMQAIWDLPELMMLSGAWPMAPQLGAYLCTPAPASADGLSIAGDGSEALTRVVSMLEDLCKHPQEPDPAIMRLEQHWHPHCNWYGPAGIGTGRGIAGFRHWHQIPFLRAMPDRGLDGQVELISHWIGEGDYVCETGWPNMRMTLSGDGWMGVAPTNRVVTLRSLDFWRVEDGLIRENWVLVDLLDFYRQVGVDVLARLREFNKARPGGAVALPDAFGLATAQP